MSTETFKQLPGVLSFQRGLILSDALFFNRFAEDAPSPVEVVRHGIRGTQNVNSDQERDVSNPQITETAKTDPAASGILVRFSLRFLPLDSTLFACASKNKELLAALRDAIDAFYARAATSEGLQEVARRYARNILNARWLWRNRSLARAITVRVMEGNALLAQVDAIKVPVQHFDDYTQAEMELGRRIADALIGQGVSHTFAIEAEVDFGMTGAVEVFPSQNYIEKKPSGFARPLYKVGHPAAFGDGADVRVMGQAALRDQKVGNALRTIDTWYPLFSEVRRPLPVEPCGANIDAQDFFRLGKDASGQKVSAFDLMRRINLVDPDTGDGQFLIASLLRGGVFSESEKAMPKKGKKASAADAQESLAQTGEEDAHDA